MAALWEHFGDQPFERGNLDAGRLSWLFGREVLPADPDNFDPADYEGLHVSTCLTAAYPAATRHRIATLLVPYRLDAPKRIFNFMDDQGYDADLYFTDPDGNRHAFIASLLQIKHLVLCVNKMDLVDYDQEAFDKIVEDFETFSHKLDIPDIHYIPISALKGEMWLFD